MIPTLKSWMKDVLFKSPSGRAWLMDRWSKQPQPAQPKAQILITFLGTGGTAAHGKVRAYAYFPAFCATLRRRGYRTHFVWSHAALRRRMRDAAPTVLIHVFGEDHCSISTPDVHDAEAKALLVINSADAGDVLADKTRSQDLFLEHGIPMPAQDPAEGLAMVRHRFGTAAPTEIVPSGTVQSNEERVVTQFVDTRRTLYDGREYTTVVRLFCIGERIVFVNPRGVPSDGLMSSVHSSDMPRDAGFLEAVTKAFREAYQDQYQTIASSIERAIGPAMLGVDVLVDRESENAYVCEAGFKMYPDSFVDFIRELSGSLPSQALLLEEGAWSTLHAHTIADLCDEAVADSTL